MFCTVCSPSYVKLTNRQANVMQLTCWEMTIKRLLYTIICMHYNVHTFNHVAGIFRSPLCKAILWVGVLWYYQHF